MSIDWGALYRSVVHCPNGCVIEEQGFPLPHDIDCELHESEEAD